MRRGVFVKAESQRTRMVQQPQLTQQGVLMIEGPGGIGKTTLLRQIAAWLLERGTVSVSSIALLVE